MKKKCSEKWNAKQFIGFYSIENEANIVSSEFVSPVDSIIFHYIAWSYFMFIVSLSLRPLHASVVEFYKSINNFFLFFLFFDALFAVAVAVAGLSNGIISLRVIVNRLNSAWTTSSTITWNTFAVQEKRTLWIWFKAIRFEAKNLCIIYKVFECLCSCYQLWLLYFTLFCFYFIWWNLWLLYLLLALNLFEFIVIIYN